MSNQYDLILIKRYNLSALILNILGEHHIDFVLPQPNPEQKVIDEVIEASGFNDNHPEYSFLVEQVKSTFTLHETTQIIDYLSLLEIAGMNISVAMLRVNPPVRPEPGKVSFQVNVCHQSYEFTEISNNRLPFVLIGLYK